MRLYICSVMRGKPLCNFPAFIEAETNLRERGYEVFNPAAKDLADGFDPSSDQPKTIGEYLREDLPEVLKSDAVCVLQDWMESQQGAHIEAFVAMSCGIPVLRYPDLVPIVPQPAFCAFWVIVEIMKLGALKHIPDTWLLEPSDNHWDKGIRHSLTHKLIRDGNQRPDGETHAKLALCRIAMAVTQQFGERLHPKPPITLD